MKNKINMKYLINFFLEKNLSPKVDRQFILSKKFNKQIKLNI